jgi:peptidoglycan/LPS O-acetylase OafA/YrhL
MTETGGRTSGFDYIRIILATAVILAHSRAVTLGMKSHVVTVASGAAAGFPRPPLGQPVVWAILPCFFALSGFLVAGSLMRSKTTVEFVLLRALRLIPALFVETILAAFILGPLVTELPLRAYFTGPEFLSYPLNIIGDIHYFLPGVFLHNPYPEVVNQQLWTIPAELFCYLTLVIISIVGLVRFRIAIPVLAVVALMALSFRGLVAPETVRRWSHGATTPNISTLWLSFLAGVTVFNLRDRIPLNKWLFGLSVLMAYVLLYDGAFQFLATLPIAYATVYAGLTDFRKTFITATGDYSYGVYLYGFPIQQTIAWMFPQNQSFIVNFTGALLVSLGMAAMSWHLVESKVLAHRKSVLAVADRAVLWLTARVKNALGASRDRGSPASPGAQDEAEQPRT